MGAINWIELLPIIVPSVIAIVLAIVTAVLKLRKDALTGMSKELSEFILTVVNAVKDGKVSQDELGKIIEEGKDVIEEAQKLLQGE